MHARLRFVPLDQGAHIPRGVAKFPDDYGSFLKRVALAELSGDSDPALLVLNGQHLGRVAARLSAVLALPRVAQGLKENFALAIDASGEGYPIVPEILAEWHAILDQHKIAAGRIAYITHNERAPGAAHHWMREAGRNAGIRVLLHHPYLHMQALWVRNARKTGDMDWADRRDAVAADQLPVGAARFLCLNNKPHAHRMVVAGRVLRGSLADVTLLSLGGATKGVAEAQMAPYLNDARRILPRFGQELDALGARLDELPLTIDGDAREDVVFAIPAATYGRASLSLVTETNFVQRNVERFTEKSVKALAAGHPSILVALPGTLRLLRSVGFESFSPYLDEGYDGITNAEDRLEAVLAEAERIAALPDSAFAALLRRCRPAAEHNMSHAGTALPELMQRRLGELTRALTWMALPDGV